MNIEELYQQLNRIEATLEQLLSQKVTKEFYSTREVAELMGKAEFTVREWCRHGRILAEKRMTGRGRSKEWMISHDEIVRIQNEGLFPL